MNVNQTIAREILMSWGYLNVTVGDLDGRNSQAKYEEYKEKQWYRPKDKSYKTGEAVKHAFRLADIAVGCITRRI